MLVIEDCKECPRDRDGSREVAFWSGEGVSRTGTLEEETWARVSSNMSEASKKRTVRQIPKPW
jgi:hypothetical protein